MSRSRFLVVVLLGCVILLVSCGGSNKPGLIATAVKGEIQAPCDINDPFGVTASTLNQTPGPSPPAPPASTTAPPATQTPSTISPAGAQAGSSTGCEGPDFSQRCV